MFKINQNQACFKVYLVLFGSKCQVANDVGVYHTEAKAAIE